VGSCDKDHAAKTKNCQLSIYRDNIDRVRDPISNVTRQWKEKENKVYYFSLSNSVRFSCC